MAFKSVFDSDFQYRSADSTDVRLTFARIRREQKRQAQRRLQQAEATAKVVVKLNPAGNEGEPRSRRA